VHLVKRLVIARLNDVRRMRSPVSKATLQLKNKRQTAFDVLQQLTANSTCRFASRLSSAPYTAFNWSVTLRPQYLARKSASAVAYKRLRETPSRLPSVSADSNRSSGITVVTTTVEISRQAAGSKQ